MKTFIINGATNPNGDTAALLAAFKDGLSGEVREVGARSRISPCVDCRRCLKASGCAIEDGMTELYEYIADCDLLAIASPVWFGSLSGTALNIASRVQTLFCADYFRGERLPEKPRRGVILLSAGGTGDIDGAVRSAKLILRYMGVPDDRVSVVTSGNTDRLPAAEDSAAIAAARNAASKM